MKEARIEVEKYLIVSIELFSAEEGGRNTPLNPDTVGYMPHFRVIGDTEYLGVRFLGGQNETITPGKIFEVTVLLMYFTQVSYDQLIQGAKFEILEGPKVVGKGTVICQV
jgi:translation elongation factor EF-Tu-like GTPase